MAEPGDRLVVAASTGLLVKPGETIKVEQFLGKGTQGQVLKVKLPDGSELALKIYHQSTLKNDSELEARINRLVSIGSPNPNFMWALDFIEIKQAGNIAEPQKGYLMKLRSKEYVSPSSFLNGQIKMEFKSLFKACLNLAKSFSALHLLGLCYKDVSIGNFFFNPENGDCVVIDIDNICYDNSIDNQHTVLGTPRFMAPEIVEGHSRPTIQSDSHSLAVLLFYMLLIGHPLEGEKEKNIRIFDVAAQKYLYGDKAVYVFNKTDPSNRPDPEIHSTTLLMAHILPEFLMATFDQAFTQGLHDINQRVPDSKWAIELRRLIDNTTHCTHCGEEVFVNEQVLKKTRCWNCKQDFSLLKISLNNAYYLASPGLELCDSGNKLIAKVIRHPKDPKILGLSNQSQQAWTATIPSKPATTIEPNKSIVIGKGICVDTHRADATLIEII